MICLVDTYRRYMARKRYEPGDRIGPYRVLLLEKDHRNTRGEWYSWFECPFDGNKFLASHKHVGDGTTYSCGCQRRTNLVGQHFGRLTVLEDSKKRDKNRRIIWKCQCNCEAKSIVYVDTTSLLLGRTTSCGCILSKGEEKIKQILNEHEVCYETEKSFEDCVNPETGAKLRFDFYLPDYNCCIEYDGEQHFRKTFYSHDNLQGRQQRDLIKTNYCKKNKINLIRISYLDYKNLSFTFLQNQLKELHV